MTQPDDLELRLLEAADAAAAAALDRRTMRRPWSEDSWALLLEDPFVFGMAAESAGCLAGVVLARIVAGEAEILVLAVAPEKRRCGIGGTLLRITLNELHRRGAERVFLEVGADNEAALTLYRGLGFVDAGRRAGYYSRGEGGDALILTRGPVVDARSGHP